MTLTIDDVGHYVAGRRFEGAGSLTLPIVNPATGQTDATLRLASVEDVDAAVEVARVAAESWSDVSLGRRQAILFRFRELLANNLDELSRIITREHGKVLSDAKGELQRGLEIVELACNITELLKGEFTDQGSTGIDVHSFRQPLGVVVGITPFNFPAMVPLWMAPLAIAAGNAFILKPSERDPSTSLRLAELWTEAGLPAGVFNVVQGDKVAVDRLIRHRDVDAVSFVGSTPVAKYIFETGTRHGKRVQALGGAKNHAVVMPDADFDNAAEHLVAAAFGSAGQRCMAISVVIAVGDAADEITRRVRAQASDIVVGNGAERGSDMGPLITRQSVERIRGAVDAAEAAGATVVLDGRDLVVDGHIEGNFFGPTILDHVSREVEAYRTELFGPVLVVLRADTLDDAIAIINESPYGNGTAIFTGSGSAARRFQRAVKVGMVGVNVPVPVPLANYSFGGWKDSLFGDSHIYGPEGVAFYTRGKVVTTRWPDESSRVRASMDFPSTH